VQIDSIQPMDVYDGQIWYQYESMELKYESLTLLVTKLNDYYTHQAMPIESVKGFRAHSKEGRKKLKPLLDELKELI